MGNASNPLDDPAADPFAIAKDAAAQLAAATGVAKHDIALTLGSGWAKAADLIGETVATVPATDIVGFGKPALTGHVGTLRSAAAAGASIMVLTNGAGGIKEHWTPGTPVLISDHINLTADSPLEGATFIDLTDLYATRLREVARSVQPDLDEGVYAQFRGPHYETPAEVQMVKAVGGHIVGMSTALEAIAAREAGMAVLGFSLITNLAAGISPDALSHAEVLEAGAAAEPVISDLLARVVAAL
jgi:purine-nucleoside phosphorylase